MSEKIPLDAPPAYTPPSNSSSAPTDQKRPVQALPRPPPLELPALTLLRSKRTILASASPRRRHLLSQIGLTPEIIPSNFAEDIPKAALTPYEYCLATASQKALSVYTSEVDSPKGEPGCIIAADTVVVSNSGEILEKPRNEADHVRMLRMLRDTGAHRVYTAVCCIAPLASARDPGYAMETGWEETVVRFDKEISDELLNAYVRTREGVDKAGGYGIQGTGAVLVDGITGGFDNVVGLPLRRTLKLIEKVIQRADDEDLLDGEIGEEEEED